MSGYERYRSNAQRIQQLTSPVRVTDIMVAPQGPQSTGGNYLGEFKNDVDNSHINSHALVQRIGDHIEFMAEMANKEHETANFQMGSDGLEIKPGSENEVTRLGFNEFSFYPKDRPLTLEEYHALLERIRGIAENCHQNLHLLLASFPVKWPDDKVYNIVVHVQCGKQAELYSFAKSVPSAIDAIYDQTTNPSFIGSSYYPKVLNNGVFSTTGGSTFTYEDTIEYIVANADASIAVKDKDEAILALVDLKAALLADKYCPPSQALLNCIDDSIDALNLNSELSAGEVANLKKLTTQFKEKYIEESNRFQDAVNLTLPKPSIITNGVTTQHYGRFLLDQVINEIVSAKDDVSKNAKALEILMATKLNIEQGIINNSVYVVNPQLTDHIDNMIAKINAGQPINALDVTTFKIRMNSYNKSCQQTYYQESLKSSRPGIFQNGITAKNVGYVSFDDLSDVLKVNSKSNNFMTRGRNLLLAMKKSIEDNNNQNAFYATPSNALLAHINAMELKYKIPYNKIPANDFVILKNLLQQYRADCETIYSNHVRSIMPQISAPIGKTASYGKEMTLAEMATLAEMTLNDPTQRNVAREQLNYLRDYLLFSKEEKTKGTKHPLFEKIDLISDKINKLDVADNLQKQYEKFKTIDVTLMNPTLDESDLKKLSECIKEIEDTLAGIKKHFSTEDTSAIRAKISKLVQAMPDLTKSSTATFESGDIDAFKEGITDIGVLISKLQNDNKIKPTESADFKLAIENYKGENFADKVESVIKIINLLKSQNIDYQSQSAQLMRILNYISYMETVSPDCKKAITAIKDKLDKNATIDDISIQDLKAKLNLESGNIANMPYWYFPSKSYADTITYDSTIPCRTPLSEFWCNAHICLDHLYATGWRSYLSNFATEKNPPLHSSEIVTSDSVNLEKAHTTNPQGKVSHMDVQSYEYSGGVAVNALTSSNLDQRLMGTRDLSTGQILGVNTINDEATKVKPKDLTYATNVDKSDPNQLVITNPPFGPPVVMRKYLTHSLLPLPLSNGQNASVDTYTTNYYIRNIDAVLNAFQLPSDAVKQKELLNEFMQNLSALTNNHTATANHFYQLLDNLEQKVNGIPAHDQPNGEDNTTFLKQIGLMRKYLDTKMLPLESYVKLRILEPLGNTLSVKQNDVVTRFSNTLDFIQQTAVNNIPVNDLAKAVMDFRKEIHALSSEPENLDALKKSCQQTEDYLRERYPEVHNEMLNIYFPEFSKLIKEVDSIDTNILIKQLKDSTKTEEEINAIQGQLNALNKLKDEIKAIQRQSLQFDNQERPIFNPYDIEKAVTQFKSDVSKIANENTATLTDLNLKIGVNIEQLKINFEALNLGKEYYEAQKAAIAEQSKVVQSEINALENSKKNTSLDGKNKWQYRDEENESLEDKILEHLNTFLMNNESSEKDPHRIAVTNLINQLNYIKKATAKKSGKAVVMTSEVIDSLISLKNMLVVYPLPSLNKAYQEMVEDLQKKYPKFYTELNNSILRNQFVIKHKGLQQYHSELKEQIKLAREKQERVKAIDIVLPKVKDEFELKKEEHEKLLIEFSKSQKALEVILEEQQQITKQQRSLNEKYGVLSEEGRELTQKLDVQIKLNQQLSANHQEMIQSRKILEQDKVNIIQDRSKLISETKDMKESLRMITEKLSEVSVECEKLSETISHNKLIHQQLLQSSALLESESTALNSKLPGFGMRCKELGKILEKDKEMLLDKVNRLKALGEINENNKGTADLLQKSIADYEKRITLNQAEYEKYNNKLIETHQQIQEKIEKCKLQLHQAETLNQEITKQMQDLKNLQTLQQQHSSEKDYIASKIHLKEQELTVLDIKMNSADELISKKTLEISSMEITLNNQDRGIEELKRKIDTNGKDAQEVNNEKVKCEKTIESLQESEINKRQVVTEQTKQVELSKETNTQLEEQVKSLTQEKAKLESELSIKGQTLDDLASRMDSIDTQYRALDSQKQHHETQQSQLSDRISLSERAKQRMQEKEQNMGENVKRLTK